VPDSFWRAFFLTDHAVISQFWGPLIGPVISMLSFVCSIGNVPLAAVLWNGGISFGGVIAFIFADLIIIPIILIYRKYYGTRVALYLLVVSYVTMVLAGLVIGAVFHAVGAVPTSRDVTAFDTTVSWNFDTFIDIAAIALIVVLLARFLRTGGVGMLRAMEAPPDLHAHQHHSA
jgi:uncharacterized membrane protein YraQ (UPF0718 family)